MACEGSPMADQTGIPARYEAQGLLGAGGQGKVFRAHDRKMDRPVAIKLVYTGSLGDASALARFRREATLLSSLRHPSLVRIYDVVVGPQCYLVQELVEGKNLEGHLAAHGPLTEDEARDFARQVASGLAYLHSEQVLHRDLKPANLIRGADGRWRIMDFGLARPLEKTRITASQWFVGTMGYMPPEVASGRDYGTASDVYQFGLVLHEALTGENANLPAEEGAFCLEWIASPTFRPRPPRPSLAPDLREWIRVCLEVDPAMRPADGTALEALLHPLPSGQHEAISSPSGALSAPLSSPDRPSSRRRAFAVLALVAILLGGLALLVPKRSPDGPSPSPPPSPTGALAPRRPPILERLQDVVRQGVENDPAGMIEVLVDLEERLRPRGGAPPPAELLAAIDGTARRDALVPPMIHALSVPAGAPPSPEARRELALSLERLWKRPVGSTPLARRCLVDAWLRFRLAAALAAEPPGETDRAYGELVEDGLLRLCLLPQGGLEFDEARTLDAVLYLVEELEGRGHPLGSLLDEFGLALALEPRVRPTLASWGPSAAIDALGPRLLGLPAVDAAAAEVNRRCFSDRQDSFEGVQTLLNLAKRRSIGLLVRTVPPEIRGELDRCLLDGQRRFRALATLATHLPEAQDALFDRLLKDASTALNLQEPVEDLTRGPRYWPPSLAPDRIVLRGIIWLRRLAWRTDHLDEKEDLAKRLDAEWMLILRLHRMFRYVWMISEDGFEVRWKGMDEDIEAAGGKPWARVARVLLARARRAFALARTEADDLIRDLVALHGRVESVAARTAWTRLVMDGLRILLGGADEEEEKRLRKVAEKLAPLVGVGAIDERAEQAVKARMRLKRLLGGAPIRELW